MKKRLFGTFGVRRTANDVLTPEFASKLAASYGTLIKGKVAIGGDTRTTTPMIKHAIIAGLMSSGCDVIDLGILPTPAVQYAVRNYYDGGIIVTASHNPPKYNGIKFVDKYGIGLSDTDEIAIENIYFDGEVDRASWKSIGNLFKNDKIIEEYIEEVLKRVDVKSIQEAKLKVVLDCGSGAGCFTAPIILRRLGCELITLNSQADGFFPGRDPEPIEANLGDLISAVKNLGADLGIAHDGDADRTICIDEKGNFVLGDKSFSLVQKRMLKEKNENLAHENTTNIIVTTVATSTAIYDIAKENNGEVIATAVGDLLVARKLKEENGLFGGEENGGLIFPDFVYGRDAALSAAKILEIMAIENKKLSELVEELPVYYSEKMKCECEDDKKQEVMEKVAGEVANLGYTIDTTDGVKIFKNEGWVIIRPSGTEPIFRCFSESNSQKTAIEMAEWGISLIEKFKN
ncbi:putative phosphomannomutase / phosphoglucomutase [Methanobrevibacter arboriphilus JCM 13429 = DSM 1125]|uniref:Putative phosphomannomutase / phosphoglucomutase n=1 Tax=Methanobrevibacter arboriphilus JCM 13429 = DSM 1125 TaxID=1300164 RepID=A0A1V6N5I2_METAZ|nr:phosphoglucosamine mutase [Methanobrevibacter arboriphilus]OQD59726.1 putative phosphomannomutase / phosphoglucomutase [Methanobrevibacter arboriphilus JCM 13429 = DSM 1125]